MTAWISPHEGEVRISVWDTFRDVLCLLQCWMNRNKIHFWNQKPILGV